MCITMLRKLNGLLSNLELFAMLYALSHPFMLQTVTVRVRLKAGAGLLSCILASNPCMILPNALHSPQGCTCNCHRQDCTCPWNVLCSAYTSNYRSWSWHRGSSSSRRDLDCHSGCLLQFCCSLSFGCCFQGGDKVATTIGFKQRVQACGASLSICCTACLHIKVYRCTSPAA